MLKHLITIAGLIALAAASWLFYGPIPAMDASRFTSITIVDRNGIPLYEPLSPSGHRGEWLQSNALPANVVSATIAAEDRRFRSHIGIDPLAIARAAMHDLRRGAFVEGGSTITQQVAKLMLAGDGATRPRTVGAKLREAIVAVRLERRYTKQAILAAYLNLAPYGNQIRGISRASRRYFGCDPDDLTVAQAAFLASLPQRPGAFNPLRDPKRAVARQREVLRRMRSLGFVSRSAHEIALGDRLRFDRGAQPTLAQHFVERVLESGQSNGSRTLVTTLDAELQRTVAGIIAARRDELLQHGAQSAAVAVLDNATGEWLAWEGSGDYFGTEFGGAIDGVIALRQPGSALKPFTYALAFERGDSPATVIPDIPSSFPTAEQGIVYTPRNYDGRYRGPLRARAALAGSENVPAVAVLSRIGAPALLRLLRNSGFADLTRTADYYGLGLTLGDAEVRLSQLVAAYAMLARGGVRVEPVMIPRRAGVALRERRVLSRRAAFWITDILSDPSARAFVFGSGGSLDFPFAVAVKTGTSQAYRDNWAIGYTREVTVGVWVGNFDRHVLRNSSGVTGAGPIFHDVMMAAMQGRKSSVDGTALAEPPANVQRAPICALSGLRPSLDCPSVESEWVPADAPVRFCSWHHAGRISWPEEYRIWAAANGQLESPRVAAPQDQKRADLRIVSPPDGATYMIDPTLRMHYQRLRLAALGSETVAWRIDERRVTATRADGRADWPLTPGVHTITASDGTGNRDSVRIYVK